MKIPNLRYPRLVIAISALLIVTDYAQAQVKSKKVSKSAPENILPLDPAVRTGKLPNGFTYYIRHNEEPKNRVVMYLANKVGSVLEDDDQRGLAHFMEHMNFNGTTHFPKNQLVDYLQKAGVRFGADLNAYTNFDETVYQLPLPTDKPELVKTGLEIMHDWAHGALLDPTEIDNERGVILEEKRMGKGPVERMAQQYYPMILNHSRYAQRLPIGVDEVLNNFKPIAIRRYFEDWYRPNLQALIVVGDIDVDKMEKDIKSQFADLKNPLHQKLRIQYTIPLNGKNQFMNVSDKEMPYTQAQVYIKQKGNPMNTESQFRVQMMQEIFNRIMRGRLSELSQVANPPFIGGTISMGEFLAGINSFTASVTAKPGEMETGFKAVWREVIRVKKFGITTTEFNRAKATYLQLMQTYLKEKDKTASDRLVKEYVQYFLHKTASPGITYEYELAKRLMGGITLTDMNALIGNAIKDTDRDILTLSPEKDKQAMPNEAAFLSWIRSVEQESITAYKDDVSELPFLKKQSVPGKIVKTVRNEKIGITTLTLGNGVKVILKKTNNKNDDINIYGIEFGGNSWYPDSMIETAKAANEVTKYGAGNYNSSQERKYLAGKQAIVAISIDEKSQQVGASTNNADLPTTLELIYAHITEPRLDVEQFKGSIKSQIAAMANNKDNPGSVFLDTILAVTTNHSPRRKRPAPEDLEKADINQAFEMFKTGFSDASKFNFIFVGSIDTVTIKPLIEKYLGSLPSTYQNKGYKDLGFHPVFGVHERTVYMGKTPRATVQMCFPCPFVYNQKNVLTLDALGQTLNIKITERLREKESGTYSPQVLAGGTSVSGGWEQIIVQFYCDPEKKDKLIAAAREEIDNMIKNGPTETDLAKFKVTAKRTLEVQQQDNGYWSNYFKKQIIENSDLNEILNNDEVLNSITVEDVKKAAGLYLDGKNYSKFVLMPDKKK